LIKKFLDWLYKIAKKIEEVELWGFNSKGKYNLITYRPKRGKGDKADKM